MARSVTDEIEDLAVRRAEAWAAGDAREAERLGNRLDGLYAEKRRAQAPHGTRRGLKAVQDRVLVERELERLMDAS